MKQKPNIAQHTTLAPCSQHLMLWLEKAPLSLAVMLTHGCDSSTKEMEAGESGQDQPWDIHSKFEAILAIQDQIHIFNLRTQKAETGRSAQIGSQDELHGEFKTSPTALWDYFKKRAEDGRINCYLLFFWSTWKRFGSQHPTWAAHICL